MKEKWPVIDTESRYRPSVPSGCLEMLAAFAALRQIVNWKKQGLILCLVGWAFPALAGDLTVAVASNFTAPMKAMAKDFERRQNHTLRLVFGSSGKFFAQIQHGAPYDYFLSADQIKPEALEKSGHAVAGSRFTYAVGRLALWVKSPNLSLDADQILTQGQIHRFRKLAMANPKLAPYGLAAQQTLQSLDLYPAIRSQLIQGENVAQTYHFVDSGNAEMGLVALSQVMALSADAGAVWVVPEKLHQPIRQDAVMLKRGQNHPAAGAFHQYLKGQEARQLLASFGYQPQ